MDTTTAWEKASDLQQPLQGKETLRRDQALIGRQDRIRYHRHLKDQKEKINIVNLHPRRQAGKQIVQLSHVGTQKEEEIVTTLNNQQEIVKGHPEAADLMILEKGQNLSLDEGRQRLSRIQTSNTMGPISLDS